MAAAQRLPPSAISATSVLGAFKERVHGHVLDILLFLHKVYGKKAYCEGRWLTTCPTWGEVLVGSDKFC